MHYEAKKNTTKEREEDGRDSHHHRLPVVAAMARGGHHCRDGCSWQPSSPTVARFFFTMFWLPCFLCAILQSNAGVFSHEEGTIPSSHPPYNLVLVFFFLIWLERKREGLFLFNLRRFRRRG